MFCYKCGKQLPDSSNVCAYCGENLRCAPQAKKAVNPNIIIFIKRENVPFLIILAIHLLVTLCAPIMVGKKNFESLYFLRCRWTTTFEELEGSQIVVLLIILATIALMIYSFKTENTKLRLAAVSVNLLTNISYDGLLHAEVVDAFSDAYKPDVVNLTINVYIMATLLVMTIVSMSKSRKNKFK